MQDLKQVHDGELASLLADTLDRLTDMARKSSACRKRLVEAERGARIAGQLTKLRVEEKLLYRSLLGL